MDFEEIKKKVDIFIPLKRLSTRVPNKVIKPFYQQINLPQIKLWQTLEVFPPEKIFILSDVEQHIEMAEKLGVRCLFIRSYEWLETMDHIARNTQSEYICTYQVTTPFLGAEMLRQFLNRFFASNHKYDSCVSAVKIQERLFDSHFQPINFVIGNGSIGSQDVDPIYKQVCGISLVSREDALNIKFNFGKKPLIFEVNPLLGTDINTPDDWEVAQTLLEIPSFREILNIQSLV